METPEPAPQPGTAPDLDPERQRLAAEYARTRRRLFFLGLGLTLAGLLALLFLGWSAGLRDWAESIWLDPWAVVALYGVALGALYTVATLPLDYYAEHLLPHRYGLSTQSFGGWVVDTLKELALSAFFGIAGLELLYWLLRTFPDWWWVLMAAAAWLFTVVMAQLGPVLFLPLFYKLTPLEDPDLVARLTSLAERAGTRVRGVYVMNMSSRTVAANAMLAGLGRTRRIILGDTLLSNYTPDEIETVLAHELAHHVHNDLPRGLLAQAALMLVGMWAASVVLEWGSGAFRLDGIADVAGLPLFALAMALFGLLVMPAGNFMSRQMERAADRYAIRTTGKAGAFRSVMLKLAGQNLAEADPPTWVRVLFHGHPSVSERVRMAEEAMR